MASSLLVLCVSAIHPLSNNTTSEIDGESNGCDAHADKSNSSNSLMKSDAKKIELTDGWYGKHVFVRFQTQIWVQLKA